MGYIMNKIEQYTREAIQIAQSPLHGYSQVNRWGPDYDCSSLLITVVNNAGIHVKEVGATYTGNMYKAFIKCGFKDVTVFHNPKTGAGLQRGDILLTPRKHTALYIGNGYMLAAHCDETGGVKGSKKGDQTGNEINIYKYSKQRFKYVLRFKECE